MLSSKIIKKITACCCMAAVMLAASGCSDSKSYVSNSNEPKELKITYVKSPLNIPSIIDKNLQTVSKEFAKTDTKISYPEINSGAKQTEALAAGSLDICSALGGTSAILAASNGVDLKIVGIYSRAPKAFTIMAKDPNITTVSDLTGKKVAGPKGTILHQILVAALAKNNLKPDSVELLSMDIPPSVNAMLNGNVDAALVAGSDVLRAQKAGAHIIISGEGLVDATIVIAARGDLVKNNPDILKRYLSAHRKNIDYMNQEQANAYDFTSQATGLAPEDVVTMAPWYDFDPEIKTSDIEDLNATQEFLLATGLQKNKIDLTPYIIKL